MPEFHFVNTGALVGQRIRDMLVARAKAQEEAADAEAKAIAAAEKQAYDRAKDERDYRLREGQFNLSQQTHADLMKQRGLEADREADKVRNAQNTIGVRSMIGERMTQGPLTEPDARTIGIMSYVEDMKPPQEVEDILNPEEPDLPTPGSYEEYYSTTDPAVKKRILGARREYYTADNVPTGGGRTAAPPVPAPVQDYLISLTAKRDPQTGQPYTLARAKQEVFGNYVWPRLREAHPQISPAGVNTLLEGIFRSPGGNDDDVFAGVEPGPAASASPSAAPAAPAPTPPAAPGGRTATTADAQRVAERLGISVEEAVQRLAAQGVTIED